MSVLEKLRGRLFCLAFGHPVEGEERLTECPSCGRVLRDRDVPEGWR